MRSLIILDQRRIFFVAAIAFSVWYILIFRDYRKITLALVVVSLPLYIYVASAIITGPPVGQLLHHLFLRTSARCRIPSKGWWPCSGPS